MNVGDVSSELDLPLVKNLPTPLITEIIAYKVSLTDWEKGYTIYVYKFGGKLVICFNVCVISLFSVNQSRFFL